jgi:hydrogenase expression/formation protein HypC
MCLAIPGKLIEVYKEGGLTMGRLDYAGTIGVACLECVPEVQLGQYVIVHAGFGISILDEEEAQKVYDLWQGLADAEAAGGSEPS